MFVRHIRNHILSVFWPRMGHVGREISTVWVIPAAVLSTRCLRPNCSDLLKNNLYTEYLTHTHLPNESLKHFAYQKLLWCYSRIFENSYRCGSNWVICEWMYMELYVCLCVYVKVGRVKKKELKSYGENIYKLLIN